MEKQIKQVKIYMILLMTFFALLFFGNTVNAESPLDNPDYELIIEEKTKNEEDDDYDDYYYEDYDNDYRFRPFVENGKYYVGDVSVEYKSYGTSYVKIKAPVDGEYFLCDDGDFNEDRLIAAYVYQYDPVINDYKESSLGYYWGKYFYLKKDEIIYVSVFNQSDDISCVRVNDKSLKYHKVTFNDYSGIPEKETDLVSIDDSNVQYDIFYAKTDFDEYDFDNRPDESEFEEGIPKEPGNYFIKIKGKSPYTGTREGYITITTETDITKMHCSFYDCMTSAFTYKKAVYASDIFNSDIKNLTYEMSYATDENPDSFTVGVPQENGDYIVRIKGTGIFTGEITDEISIAPVFYSLSKSRTRGEFYNYTPRKQTGNIKLKGEIRIRETNINLKDSDYKLLGYYKDDNKEDFLEGTPTMPGTYTFKFRGINRFCGTLYRTIEVVENTVDLYKFSTSYENQKPLGDHKFVFNDDEIIYGEDFICDRYCDSNDTSKWIDGAPTLPGTYQVHLVGLGKVSGDCIKNLTIRHRNVTPSTVPESDDPTDIPEEPTPSPVPEIDNPTDIPEEATPSPIPESENPADIPVVLTPSPVPTSVVTQAPTPVSDGNNDSAIGDIVTVSESDYLLTSENTVTYSLLKNKSAKKITVPSSVNINGRKYKVTAISNKAFKGRKKLKKVIIGSNVTKIGSNAFSGDLNLDTIIIKSNGLKSVGKNAFKGINKKATFKVPKKKIKTYKKLFNSKTGYKKTMKVKK